MIASKEMKLKITLPDNTQREFDGPVTVKEIAQQIGAGLAKAAIAGMVNGKLVDTFFKVEQDAHIKIITDRDPQALEVIRHSVAHILAQAVKALFPTVQITIGPVIENGFYYDFAFERAFTTDDLGEIEQKMQEIIDQDYVITRRIVSRDQATSFFCEQGEHYKVKIIEDIPKEEVLTIYQQGEFSDLCRGPHVPSTGFIKAFKLTKVSGAYWRGDPKNEMLQRIYGTAWPNQKMLAEYLRQQEEAEKRDHRKIAKTLDLFHVQEEAPGMIFWHPNGWQIYRTIRDYVGQKVIENGFEEVTTPQIVDLELWKKSGHWNNFGQEMFTVETENRKFAIKPMSCPCHVQLFKQGLKSYRDLPVRFAEFGCVHRNELTGAMHGLMRVRQLTQDDGHIFCTEDQIQEEASNFMHSLLEVYRDFGFNDVFLRLATRPEKRIGDDVLWDHAEAALARSLESLGLSYEVKAGEGAFYGPKIEFHLRDCLGRMWQCGTLQLDYAMPIRLEAFYVAEDGTKKHPVVLHRAILGSIERFMGILLEHYAGKLPIWLAPIQVIVMNITDKQRNYAIDLVKNLNNHGIRAKGDLRNEKISFKIREHTIGLVPYLLVVGDREVASVSVSVRTQAGDDLGSMSEMQFIEYIQKAVAKRGRTE